MRISARVYRFREKKHRKKKPDYTYRKLDKFVFVFLTWSLFDKTKFIQGNVISQKNNLFLISENICGKRSFERVHVHMLNT